jgi:proteasome activator subunit 3 (PA28 gamma)
LKPLILNLYDTVILLRNWIALMIPKIEDGNTFGVEVQENMLVQLRRKFLQARVFLNETELRTLIEINYEKIIRKKVEE